MGVQALITVDHVGALGLLCRHDEFVLAAACFDTRGHSLMMARFASFVLGGRCCDYLISTRQRD